MGHFSDDDFWAEVAKCQLLCRPHHKEKSSREGSFSIYGERNPNSKLTASEVIDIRKFSSMGYSSYTLGRHYGVDPSHIRAIIRRESWKSI